MLAIGLQGIGGMNSFAAGVLQEFRKHSLRPDIISATSGAILTTYYFLDEDPNAIDSYYQEFYESELASVSQPLKFMYDMFWGIPGVVRPIYPVERFFENFPFMKMSDWINYFFPSQLYKPTRPQQFYEDIATRFAMADIGIIINAYNFPKDQAVLYVNNAALEKTELCLGEHKDFIVKEISPDGIKASLCLLQYGDHNGEYDGAYQFNPVLDPLTIADNIILVTVEPLGKSWKSKIENYFEAEDFKLKMMFKNALYAELNEIHLINKLIREKRLQDPKYKEIALHIIQPTFYRGYFGYFVEVRKFFADGTRQAKKFLQSMQAI